MTLQKTKEVPKSPDYAFRRRYSQFKVWVSLKSNINKTFYAKDCRSTLMQIKCGHVKQVVFDQQMGLNDCLAIEKYFSGKYITLQIYRRLPDGNWPEQDDYYMKFINGNLVEQSATPLSPNIYCEVQWQDVSFKLVPIEHKPAPSEPEAKEEPRYTKQPAGTRLANGPSHISQFIPGSAARYGFSKQ